MPNRKKYDGGGQVGLIPGAQVVYIPQTQQPHIQPTLPQNYRRFQLSMAGPQKTSNYGRNNADENKATVSSALNRMIDNYEAGSAVDDAQSAGLYNDPSSVGYTAPNQNAINGLSGSQQQQGFQGFTAPATLDNAGGIAGLAGGLPLTDGSISIQTANRGGRIHRDSGGYIPGGGQNDYLGQVTGGMGSGGGMGMKNNMPSGGGMNLISYGGGGAGNNGSSPSSGQMALQNQTENGIADYLGIGNGLGAGGTNSGGFGGAALSGIGSMFENRGGAVRQGYDAGGATGFMPGLISGPPAGSGSSSSSGGGGMGGLGSIISLASMFMNKGGPVSNHMADGGTPFGVPSGGEVFHNGGLFDTKGPGRTDNINVSVPVDSHVIPADVVSGLGQGNTKAGAGVLDHILPTRTQAPLHTLRSTIPGRNHFASGGATHTPIVAAGGEYLVSPEQVRALGHGSLKDGHEVLDKFILKARKETAKTLHKLPGPKKS